MLRFGLIVCGLWFACYLFLCWQRWLIARHYCQSFRLMSIRDIIEAWELVGTESNRPTLTRMMIVAIPIACLAAAWIVAECLRLN